MAEFRVHITQAKYNEGLAEHLLDNSYHDWAITVCFYAAIHYFEARLFLEYSENPRKHTDTSIPVDQNGNQENTPHRWRSDLVRRVCPKSAYKSFINLKQISEWSRYLIQTSGSTGSCSNFLPEPAHLYFSSEDVIRAQRKLQEMKVGCKVDLAELIHELELRRLYKHYTVI